MSGKLTPAEERYEKMLMSLSPGERLMMVSDMLHTAGMPPDEARDPRLVRRRIFLAFYGDEMDTERREKILTVLDRALESR